MKEMKRILSLVLCLAMIVGMLPMFALNADAATGEVIDAAIFCSDVHGSSSAVSSAFSGIKTADSTFNPSTATFVGDTQMAASSVTSAAQGVYSGVKCYYAYGNHDNEGNYGISDVTGLLYGDSTTNYYIYAISQTSMASSNPDTTGFTSTVAGLDKSKPLFIASHLPLHDRRGDSNGAAAWYEAISAAAEQMDIVFFWAHNHTGENGVDQAAFYVAKDGDETITLENTSTVVTPNFTYMNAGFVDMSSARGGVVTTVKIYSDALVFQDYTSSGAFTGEYSHNVEVAREFASTSGSGDSGSTDESTPATTAPTEGEDEEGNGATTLEWVTITDPDEPYTIYHYTQVDTIVSGQQYVIVDNDQDHALMLDVTGAAITRGDSEITSEVDLTQWTFTDNTDYWYITNGENYLKYSNKAVNATAGAEEKAQLTVVNNEGNVAVYKSAGSNGNMHLFHNGYGWHFSGGNTDLLNLYSYTSQETAYRTAGLYGRIAGNSTYEVAYGTAPIYVEQLLLEGITAYTTSDITTEGTEVVDSDLTLTYSPAFSNTTPGNYTVTVTYNGVALGEVTLTVAEEASSNEVTLGSAGVEKTVYVLTNSLTNGGEYLIVNVNAAGSGYALGHSGSSVASDAVTVINDGTNIYIESTDVDSTSIWTAATYSSGFNLTNGGYYLLASGSTSAISFKTSATSNRYWNYTSDDLGCFGGNQTHYIYYSGGFVSAKNSGSEEIYIYQKQTIDTSSEVTYTMRASDLKQVVDTANAASLTADLDFCLQGNGADLTTLPSGGSYSFTELSDAKNIISAIGTDGTVTFTGTTGTATVKVAYTWTADDGNTYTIYKNISIEATEPYYTLDLHKQTTDESGNVVAGDEITAPVAIKGIEAGDTYSVWAVIKEYDGVIEDGEDGKDIGAVGTAIEWSSSDTSVATVDPTTGIITFTGKEGTVQITADYAYGTEGKLATDTITISVTQSQYNVPADGTTDFPEYPNEGAIRYDKTAEAVGNFSQTGIAQLELSMTGVPYSKGSEIDVVLVLDASGSMNSTTIPALQEAAYEFVKLICTNEDGTVNNNRVAIVFFGKGVRYTTDGYSAISDNLDTTGGVSVTSGDSNAYGYTLATVDSVDTSSDIYKVIYSGYPTSGSGSSIEGGMSGGTYYSYGLAVAEAILENARTDGTGNNRQQYCLFLSDGAPTKYTYITNYSTATDSDDDGEKEYTTSSGSGNSEGDASTTTAGHYEYYSALMRDADVNIYGVGCALSKASYPNSYSFFTKIAGSEDDVYFVTEAEIEEGALADSFKDTAQKMLQAATDVIVEDQIANEYTMIFDIPTDTNYDHTITTDQEFYIEFVKYTLDATTHERTGTSTSVTKLYLIDSNGAAAGGSYSAGSTATTAYAAPTFANATLGDKGTLYFWTTDSSYAAKAAATYNDGTNTYYFIPYGIKATDTGYDSTKWFNMTAGAYASGEIDSVTNTSTDLVIATPYFVYNASTRMLYWTVEKLENATTEYALRYFLYLDDSATDISEDTETDPGPYPTNHHAYITYTNFNGNDCRQTFPVPQLTWNGAQVSYVFYLVNSKGEPINKSGQVVDFANATFITDIFTEHVVWNDAETPETEAGFAYLDAMYKAEELLPDEYSLYDTSAYYELYVYEDAEGNTLDNYFKITGSEANGSTSSTTKVYITKAGTKYSAYGTYTEDNVYTGFDFGNTTVAFAVVWEPSLMPDTVVVDYGLDVLINVVQNDLMQNTISGIGLGKEAYGNTEINTGVSTTSKLGTAALTVDGNTISIENENQIRFSQNDMTFEAPVTFYYESPVEYYEGSNKREGYMYSSVTVIPATTIYYEDDYLTYDGNWGTDGTAESATQAQDRPGVSQIAAAIDADNNYGYDKAYATMAGASMASSHKITVSDGIDGMASFDFYGTGFDVISMTDTTTGTIFVRVYAYNEDGTLDTSKAVASHVVDTYYGYAYALCKVTYTYTVNADGSADWVITADEIVETAGETTEKPEKPENGDTYIAYFKKWINVDSNDPNALWQVPVMKISGLTYGKYQAQIIAAYDEFFDNVGDGSYDFYLDAIRVYDPTGNRNEDANAAYVKDGEGWPSYKEVRNYVIEQSVESGLGDDAVEGIVFIDSNAAASKVADYISYGPNNELYLAPGQAIAFELSATATAGEVAKIQMALKTVYGSASVKIYATDGTTVLNTTLETATDMYYDITSLNGKTVVIMNTGDSGVLSITNVKTTFTQEQTAAAPAMFMLRRSSVDAALATMNVEEVPETEPTEPETEPTEPETEPTEPETEPTEPETEPTEPETEPTEPETEPTEPETEPTEPTEPSYEEKIEEIVKEVGEIIKKLFGWIFG